MMRGRNGQTLTVGVILAVALRASPLPAQSPATSSPPTATSVSLLAGAGFPFRETAAKRSGLFGVSFSHRVRGQVEALGDVTALFDGRSRSGNSGEGSLASSGVLVRGGIRRFKRSGRAVAYYGAGLSFARYKSQVGVFKAACTLCAVRDGLGFFGTFGVGTSLTPRRWGLEPWLGVDIMVDSLSVSGIVDSTNPTEIETGDVWLSVRGSFGFRF
jgi:hypothetical protein